MQIDKRAGLRSFKREVSKARDFNTVIIPIGRFPLYFNDDSTLLVACFLHKNNIGSTSK